VAERDAAAAAHEKATADVQWLGEERARLLADAEQAVRRASHDAALRSAVAVMMTRAAQMQNGAT